MIVEYRKHAKPAPPVSGYVLTCRRCKRELATKHVRGMAGAMKRHREKHHPKLKGKISYSTRIVVYT